MSTHPPRLEGAECEPRVSEERVDYSGGVGAKSVRVFCMWFTFEAISVGRFEAFRDTVLRKCPNMRRPKVSKGGFQGRVHAVHAVHAISVGSLQNRLPIEIACTACTACTRLC